MDSWNPQQPVKTILKGMSMTDIILRSAIIEGIRDLRAKPYLLAFVFASLNQDDLTRESYGTNEMDQAIKWFLKTDIPVVLDVRIDSPKFPIVSIKLASQSHAEATLADVNYQPSELADFDWPNLAGPFVASYDYTTGIVTIPDSVAETLVTAVGQVVVDNAGNSWPITATPDYTHLQIAANQTVDFTQTYIRGQSPAYITTLESMLFQETYTIGCHVQAEASHLIYLYSIITFILLAYKQSLLEARGLERTLFTASDFIQNPTFKNELIFSRYISLTGYIDQGWPKTISQKANAINTTIQIADSGHLFDPPTAATQLWIGDQDTIGNGLMPPNLPIPTGGNVGTGAGPYPLVYWGVVDAPGSITAGFVQSLPVAVPQPGRQNPLITFDAVGSGLYCWYAYPASYGGTSTNFVDGGTNFPFGASNVATVNVTDAFGVVRPYFVFRSDYPNLGLVYLTVT